MKSQTGLELMGYDFIVISLSSVKSHMFVAEWTAVAAVKRRPPQRRRRRWACRPRGFRSTVTRRQGNIEAAAMLPSPTLLHPEIAPSPLLCLQSSLIMPCARTLSCCRLTGASSKFKSCARPWRQRYAMPRCSDERTLPDARRHKRGDARGTRGHPAG